MNRQRPEGTGRAVATEHGPHHEGLEALTRYTSRDSVVIATAPSVLIGRGGDESDPNLSCEDVGGLSVVIRDLDRPHLNLILHGRGGDLAAAAETIRLLRGRFQSIRALVPHRAESAMALIACACDVVMMPDDAVIGATDDIRFRPVSASAAREWLSRHCEHPDRADRARSIDDVFSTEAGPRSPLTAASARLQGLPISIIPRRSAIGRNLAVIRQEVDEMMRAASLIRVIDCQKGPTYLVSTAVGRPNIENQQASSEG